MPNHQTKRKPFRFLQLPLSFFVISLSTSAFAADSDHYPIAGTQPDQRPAHAPVIETTDKSNNWYQQALRGVDPPYPSSLRFLEDQGGWHTPFSHAGATPPYDLRNYYKP